MGGKTVADLVRESRAKIENLTVEQVAAEAEQPGVVLVDLREPSECKADGVLAGSILIRAAFLEWRADATTSYHHKALQPDARIILHCSHGMRSAMAADMMQQMGYRNVAHLDGGLMAWKAAGLELVPAG